jgi:hypothetical protein
VKIKALERLCGTGANAGAGMRFFLEEESFSYGLADFLTGVYPERIEARSAGGNAEIRLIFSG